MRNSEAKYGYAVYASDDCRVWQWAGWELTVAEAETTLMSSGGGGYRFGTIIPQHEIDRRLLNEDGTLRLVDWRP